MISSAVDQLERVGEAAVRFSAELCLHRYLRYNPFLFQFVKTKEIPASCTFHFHFNLRNRKLGPGGSGLQCLRPGAPISVTGVRCHLDAIGLFRFQLRDAIAESLPVPRGTLQVRSPFPQLRPANSVPDRVPDSVFVDFSVRR